MDAGIEERLIQGGIGIQHRQASLLGRIAALGIRFHHQELHPFPGELFGDLAADAAIAAENHVIVHAP